MRETIGVKTTPMTTISVSVRAAERDDRRDRDHDQRQREHGVDDAADDVVDDAAEVAGDETDDRAAGDAEQRRERRDLQHVGRAGEDAREDVAAERSVPSQCARPAGPSSGSKLWSEWIVRGQAASPTIAQKTHQPTIDEPDEERLRARELPQRLAARDARLGRPAGGQRAQGRATASFGASEADARVEQRVEQVGDERRGEIDEADDQSTPLCSSVKSLFCAAV